MRWSAVLLLAFCIVQCARAQNNRDVDSLQAALRAHPQEDSLRAQTLYLLSREYWDRDLDTAFALADELLKLSQRIH